MSPCPTASNQEDVKTATWFRIACSKQPACIAEVMDEGSKLELMNPFLLLSVRGSYPATLGLVLQTSCGRPKKEEWHRGSRDVSQKSHTDWWVVFENTNKISEATGRSEWWVLLRYVERTQWRLGGAQV